MKTEMQKRLFGLALFLFAVIIAAEGAMAGEPSRVAILPFKINADRDVSFLQKGIVDMFTSRLSWEDRVVVIDRDETDHALRSVSMPVNEEIARATGSGLQADYVLFGSLTIFGQSASLDARMVDVHQKRPTLTFFKQMKTIDEVIPQVDLLAMEINETVFAHPGSLLPGKSTGQAKVPSPKPPTAEAPGHTISGGMELAGFWKSQNFKIFIKGLSLGDVDGDSKTETVFISDRHIYVHRFENKRFIRIKEIAGKGSQRFIGVDVADINGNGRAEIFVTSLKGAGQRLDSFVLEWNGDDFRRINKGNHPETYSCKYRSLSPVIIPSFISLSRLLLYSASFAARKYPFPPAAPCLFAMTKFLICFGSGTDFGTSRFASSINFSLRLRSDSQRRTHLLPKIGVVIDSICSELICAIKVPCGISMELFCSRIDLHFLSTISKNESTKTISSIKPNLLYKFSRFFSEIKIVLKPSSFAPFSTCKAQ